MCSDDDQNQYEDEDDRMRRRNDEWFENENSSCSRCQVPTRTLIDPAGPLLLSPCYGDDDDDVMMMTMVMNMILSTEFTQKKLFETKFCFFFV